MQFTYLKNTFGSWIRSGLWGKRNVLGVYSDEDWLEKECK